MDVAFICTGNICRSPMAEVLLRARLAERAPDVVVGSAGLLFDGRPAEPQAVKAMRGRGLDLTSHGARRISAELLADTSLILGMQRTHVREVAELAPELFARSFTLPELVTAAGVVGAREPGEHLRAWAERIGSLRSVDDYRFAAPHTEIDDPMGRSVRTFRACADEIDALLERLVDLAWPLPAPTTGPDHPATPAHATTGGPHADRDRR